MISVLYFSQPLGAGELDSTWHNIQFLSSEFPSSQSGSVDIRRYFLWMRRGPESRVCWFSTTETRYLNHLGFPYNTSIEDCFTGIQSVSGRVTEIVSCNRVEASVIVALDGYMQQTFKKVTCTYLHIATDGQLDTCTWEKKYIESPHSEAQSEPDSEESEETPEEVEVPFISCHLRERGVTEIGVKLPALRQAFATLLASSHNQNFLFVAGKKIVMRLAAASKQEAVRVQLAYEDLIRFLRTPSNQGSIAAELSWENLHHYNFVDVFYELLIFRCFTSGLVPETKFKGGFLERLMALIRTWEADMWEPASQIYFNELIVQLTDLCEVLFSQPLELFYYPAALAHAVRRLLMQHVQLMMDNLEKL
ncbi:uncharacterized protein LOC131369339 [Hemibagrus wyckioides]|uniref:uncharacterized protein LOC131369339 n=1 Tax=Hemibagrus wyckioides TaxID=337641 RepID=UPI00266D3006|nr:uncharacterized protein LOC131369339 [Hemibagrus wyckioides]